MTGGRGVAAEPGGQEFPADHGVVYIIGSPGIGTWVTLAQWVSTFLML